jgi:hypothetical protein
VLVFVIQRFERSLVSITLNRAALNGAKRWNVWNDWNVHRFLVLSNIELNDLNRAQLLNDLNEYPERV